MRLPKPAEELSAESKYLYEVLNEESDLACVVIGAAFLESALGTLLSRTLRSSKITDKLLGPNGALSSFATRADLSYCLTLIDKCYHQNLRTVLEIRNKFAHSNLQLGFHDQTIREKCNELTEWRWMISMESEEPLKDVDEKGLRMRARNQFNLNPRVSLTQTVSEPVDRSQSARLLGSDTGQRALRSNGERYARSCRLSLAGDGESS